MAPRRCMIRGRGSNWQKGRSQQWVRYSSKRRATAGRPYRSINRSTGAANLAEPLGTLACGAMGAQRGADGAARSCYRFWFVWIN